MLCVSSACAGSYDEVWGIKISECDEKCAQAIDCLAYEYSTIDSYNRRAIAASPPLFFLLEIIAECLSVSICTPDL
eukprot:3847358-Pleurochrysis_carterae.AAC.1